VEQQLPSRMLRMQPLEYLLSVDSPFRGTDVAQV
jgi:hypothetical protein